MQVQFRQHQDSRFREHAVMLTYAYESLQREYDIIIYVLCM